MRSLLDDGASQAWGHATVLRPRVDGVSSGQIEVSDALAQRRVALHRDAVVALMLDDAGVAKMDGMGSLRERFQILGIGPTAAEDEVLSGLAHWRRRNWVPSLDYYLWSRRAEFADDGPEWSAIREDTLDRLRRDASTQGDARRSTGSRPLPRVSLPTVPCGTVLARRRSTPRPRGKPLSIADVGAILWFGVQSQRRPSGLRSEPENAPVFDVYLAIYPEESGAADVPCGIHFYDIDGHFLTHRPEIDLRERMASALFGQPAPRSAAATIMLVANFDRLQWRYRHEREYRVLFVETGRLMGALLAVATSLDFETAITPAVHDSLLSGIIGLTNEDAQVVYTLSLG